MTLRQRIDRLQGKRGKATTGPSVILLCDGRSGEPMTALLIGKDNITRKAGETAEAFTARATGEAEAAMHLPDNGRDALATGKAPQWSRGKLVMQYLRAKHGVQAGSGDNQSA